MNTLKSPARVHGLDATRAAALLLGIVLHSLLPFIHSMPWLVVDSRDSEAAFVAVYLIHLFRMSLFMLLAGYFGRMVTLRRGTRAYLRGRCVRILLPVFAFWPMAVLPLGLLSAVAASHGVGAAAPDPSTTGPLQWFTPGHLWFLLVLFEVSVLTLLSRAVLLRLLGVDGTSRLAEGVGNLLAGPAGVLLALIPHAAALLLQGGDPSIGITEPTTILPTISSTVGYLGAFLTGWFLHASPGSLERFGKAWAPRLALGAVFAVLPWTGTLSWRPLSAVIVALASWLLVLGTAGLGVRLIDREHPAIRYLADASYWMYLMHLPLLVALEIPLASLPWPVWAKLIPTWAVCLAVLLGSYHWLVRSTWVGAWLTGHRHPRKSPRRSKAPVPTASAGRRERPTGSR